MNIIVIGNGFDLAHGLPTKYTDFLEFVKVLNNVLEERNKDYDCIDMCNINVQIKTLIKENITQQIEQWKSLLNDNFWIEYFLQNDMHGKENWIDFESEISDLIQSIHMDMYEKRSLTSMYEEIDGIFINEFLENYLWKDNVDRKLNIYKDIKDKLYDDLNRLIKALEIYLYQYVNKINCEKKLLDIQEIIAEKEICKILSFNYTNTIERVYIDKSNMDIDFIHGKANKDLEIEKNNMVLGIDEFLPAEKQNINVEFVEFKKFYQRIYKETGCKYKNWVDEIKSEHSLYVKKIAKANFLYDEAMICKNCKKHNLYIFGHSLDVTDGDILRDLILNDNVSTTIFYHNKENMGKQITNLVKVVGENELIRRTGGSTRTIKFKLQKNLI